MPTIDATVTVLEQKLTAAIAEEMQDNAVIDDILRQCEALYANERLTQYSEPEIARLTEFSETLAGLITTLKTEQASLKKDLSTLLSGKKMRKHFS